MFSPKDRLQPVVCTVGLKPGPPKLGEGIAAWLKWGCPITLRLLKGLSPARGARFFPPEADRRSRPPPADKLRMT